MRRSQNAPVSHEVGIITPDLELFHLARSLRDETPVNYTIRLGMVETAHRIAPRLVNDGAKVLISRGVTTDIIRSLNLPVPVLDILVSEYDTVGLLTQARAYSSRIAVIGFSGLVRAARELAPLLSVDVGIFQVSSMREIYASVLRAKDEGYTVVVGNSYSVLFGKRIGMHGVPLLTPPANLLNVIAEAGKVARAMTSENEWRARQHVLINSVSENIITIDDHGRPITGTSPLSPRGAAFIDSLGGEAAMRGLLEKNGVLEAIRDGRNWEGEIVDAQEHPYQLRVLPVHAEARDKEAILIASLTAAPGERGRRKLFEKGLVAHYHLEDILHASSAMKSLIKKARRFAVSEAPVFIRGESGTGKEMLAQGIHNASRRRYGPFVAISCAAIPENLLESELFGYQGGAFTGARKNGKPGLLELADTGTLFLDEVAELSLPFQAKLLRVVEEQAFMRVGGDHVIRTDARIICATNRDLALMVNSGEFRLDLYYRLGTLPLRLPPLRERTRDIGPIVMSAATEVCKRLDRTVPQLTDDALALLERHPFPGNVRELIGLLERVLAAEEAPVLDAATLAPYLDTRIAAPQEEVSCFGNLAAEFPLDQKNLVRQALFRAGGNRAEAARLLGISTTTLWRRLKRLGLEDG